MSAEMLETIKRQAESLTAQEKLSLGTYLLEQARTTDTPLDEETWNVLGRRGFLDQIVLGLNDYKGSLYLNRYDES